MILVVFSVVHCDLSLPQGLVRATSIYIVHFFTCPLASQNKVNSDRFLKPGLASPRVSLPLHSVSQPKLQGWPRYNRRGNILQLFYFLMFIYFWESGRTEGEGQRIQSGLCADSKEPDVGLKLTNCEIMTWVEVGRLTNWTTEAPHIPIFNLRIGILVQGGRSHCCHLWKLPQD